MPNVEARLPLERPQAAKGTACQRWAVNYSDLLGLLLSRSPVFGSAVQMCDRDHYDLTLGQPIDNSIGKPADKTSARSRAQRRIGIRKLLDAIQCFSNGFSVASAKTRQLLLIVCDGLIKFAFRRLVETNFQGLSYLANTSSSETVSISPRSAASIRDSASFAQS